MFIFLFFMVRGYGFSLFKIIYRFLYELKFKDGGVCIVKFFKGRRNKM